MVTSHWAGVRLSQSFFLVERWEIITAKTLQPQQLLVYLERCQGHSCHGLQSKYYSQMAKQYCENLKNIYILYCPVLLRSTLSTASFEPSQCKQNHTKVNCAETGWYKLVLVLRTHRNSETGALPGISVVVQIWYQSVTSTMLVTLVCVFLPDSLQRLQPWISVEQTLFSWVINYLTCAPLCLH